MRSSKQLQRRLLISAVALAITTMPMLSANGQAQTTGINSSAASQPDMTGQDWLLKARQSLAVGNVAGASSAVEQARLTEATFGTGDSPEQIEAMIGRQNRLVDLYQQGSADSGYDTEAAKFLMEQAEVLVKYRDYETARVLADQSKKFTSVNFNTFSITPDRLIQIIDVANTSVPSIPSVDPKTEVSKLMAQASLYVDQGKWDHAKALVQEAKTYNLGDDQFAKGETRPWQMEMAIDNALNLQKSAVDPKNSVASASFNETPDAPQAVAPAKYDPATDPTKVIPAGFDAPPEGGVIPPMPPVPGPNAIVKKFQDAVPNRGQQMYRSGVEALQTDNPARAREFFQLAMQYPADLDEPTQQAIRTQLSQIDAATVAATKRPPVAQTSAVDEEFGYGLKDKSEFAKLQSEIFRERQAAERMLESDPRGALQRLSMLRTKVASAQVAGETSRPLLKMVDRDITKFQKYIEQNLSSIENEEENDAARAAVERTRQRRLDVDQQLSQLVDEYNKLIDEERFAEADLVVRQAEELAPGTEIVNVLREKHIVLHNSRRFEIDRRDRELRYMDAIAESYNVSRAMRTDQPIELDPDIDGYVDRVRGRANRQESLRYSSDATRQIWNKLKNTEVEGEYRGTLAEAMDQLSRQAGLNIIFDTIALQDAGISTEQLVDAAIRNPISLESALNVILGNVRLDFSVENEVIKVTSRDAQETTLTTETYYIGDLLAPLKNYQDPNRLTFNQPGNNPLGAGSLNVDNTSPASFGGNPAQAAMAQQFGGSGTNPIGGFGGYGGAGNDPRRGTPYFGSVGQQAQGGITIQDFQQLTNLIQQTVSSDSWETNGGGNGTIQPFPPNLSLIVTNSQKVQDEIRALLKKLRELNDVQIVVEVRFVAIQDNFFERVGIDFDFGIDNGAASGITDGQSSIIGNTGTAGVGNFGNQTVTFTQDSFTSSIPSFGGFDAATAASFGFAILSDIEVFFLLQAAKGSTRATITEAPTVVMFNGQSASVNDTQQRPFVTSVVPVVGDFAVAHQPIITILPDGTQLNVTATVSSDRRSVSMSLVPYFTEVTEVETFTFTGSTTTEIATDSLLDDLLDTLDLTNDASDDEIQTVSDGVTIQLPVLAQTSVNTVVSVPDGGTILMGGIKRMRETRSENGVPMLSSIPYINRLFTNVGTGRETTNLMMMVTPRIIIQEEEERKQIGVFGDDN